VDTDITALVQSAGSGDAAARDALFTLLYDELKRIARKQLRGSASPTLDTTGLVHDAYLKLVAPADLNLQGRRHFFVLAAKAMRQIVIDHARARAAGKRGGGSVQAVTLNEAMDQPAQEVAPDKLLELDRALTTLEASQPRLSSLIELRFFTGLDLAEIAAMQEVSERTLNRDWRRARAELYAVMYS
jgi:RNA polymerase sigma factor (TIGR02999 family)